MKQQSTALDNVRLAKKMNVECKLNYAVGSGRQSKPYTLSRIYKIYLKIIDEGLSPWEFNTKEIAKRMQKKATVCPRSRSCDAHIRCLQPDGDYYSCGAFGDDKEYSISFEEEMSGGAVQTPLSDNLELAGMKAECFGCSLFELCNGCRKTVKDMKEARLVDEHCALMKTMEERLNRLPQDELSAS